MKAQYDNKLLSSFLLYLDNKILTKGDAFYNHSGLLYPVANSFSSYYTHSAPFRQMVYDKSITGANQITGVYIDGVLNTPSSAGPLISIDPNKGLAYFNTDLSASTISARYAIKDVNLVITDEREERLLFEKQYFLNPKTEQVVAGLLPDDLTYPIIFLKIHGASNDAFAFGGLDNSVSSIRAIIIADSAYLLDALCSIMRDCRNDRFTILENSSIPVDSLGGYTGSFNYTGVNINPLPIVWNVDVSKILPSKGQLTDLNPNVLCAFADFEISDIRTHK